MQITVVDKDVDGIEFLVPSMTTVGGRVIVDDGSPMPRMALSFVGSGGTVNAMISRDGSFSIQIPEGDKRIVVSGIPGVYSLKSIALGSSDLDSGTIESERIGHSRRRYHARWSAAGHVVQGERTGCPSGIESGSDSNPGYAVGPVDARS